MRPVAIICAPWRTRTPVEATKTDEAVAHLLQQGWCPVFLPWALCSFLDDQKPVDREVALACSDGFVASLASVPSAAMFVLPGRVTEGMTRDMKLWEGPGAQGALRLCRRITFTDRDAP